MVKGGAFGWKCSGTRPRRDLRRRDRRLRRKRQRAGQGRRRWRRFATRVRAAGRKCRKVALTSAIKGVGPEKIASSPITDGRFSGRDRLAASATSAPKPPRVDLMAPLEPAGLIDIDSAGHLKVRLSEDRARRAKQSKPCRPATLPAVLRGSNGARATSADTPARRRVGLAGGVQRSNATAFSSQLSSFSDRCGCHAHACCGQEPNRRKPPQHAHDKRGHGTDFSRSTQNANANYDTLPAFSGRLSTR